MTISFCFFEPFLIKQHTKPSNLNLNTQKHNYRLRAHTTTLRKFSRHIKAKACKSLQGRSHIMSQIWNVWIWQQNPSVHSQGPSLPFLPSLQLSLTVFPYLLPLTYAQSLSNHNGINQPKLLKVVPSRIPPDCSSYESVCVHVWVYYIHKSSP